MKFTEAKLEQAIVDLLAIEGYPHYLGESIDSEFERNPEEVLLETDLRKFLANRYKDQHFTDKEI